MVSPNRSRDGLPRSVHCSWSFSSSSHSRRGPSCLTRWPWSPSVVWWANAHDGPSGVAICVMRSSESGGVDLLAGHSAEVLLGKLAPSRSE